jgi:hypothetical protein
LYFTGWRGFIVRVLVLVFISLFIVIVGYVTRSFKLYFREVKKNIYRWRIYPFRRAGSESSNYKIENHLAKGPFSSTLVQPVSSTLSINHNTVRLSLDLLSFS